MNIYTVSQLNRYLVNMIDADYLLSNVTVSGEISNCKYHSMGHIYFTLKDENCSMPCVMFRSSVDKGLKFRLENGQSVVITGQVAMYEKDGRIQIYARRIIQPEDKKGKLYEEFEKLKTKLYEEGLFDFETKKPIPQFPKVVGVVTAETGAAIQDIINVTHRRNPYVQLILYPAKVQGEGAARTIVDGIETLDKMGCDTIIVGRGGGSIEDLWAFNEEIVARAIYAAKTPIISGTGHEVDNTIADYVADMRAPTPSAAAELAVPDVMTTVRQVREMRLRLDNSIVSKLNQKKMDLMRVNTRLQKLSPELKLREKQQTLAGLYDRLDVALQNKFQRVQHRFEIDVARLHGLSPTAKLVGGFGYIEVGESPLLTTAKAKKGDKIHVIVSDGEIEGTVEKVTKRKK